MPTFELPADIDPAVLIPGTIVRAFLDTDVTDLEVLSVIPMIVCRTPDGREVTLGADQVYVRPQETGS